MGYACFNCGYARDCTLSVDALWQVRVAQLLCTAFNDLDCGVKLNEGLQIHKVDHFGVTSSAKIYTEHGIVRSALRRFRA